MPFLELMMLICFGCSWPASLYKSYKSKSTAGKSALFSVFILIGYICGILNKILYHPDFVIYVYGLNTCMVIADLALWVRNRRWEIRAESGKAAGL